MKIALTGRMRVGKDALAEYAIEKYGFTRFAFGDGIKESCFKMFPDKMKKGKNRSILQKFGQLMRYEFDENVWINYCFNQINADAKKRKESKFSTLNAIITDLRQPNEYQKCKEEGFVIIKVHTDDDIRLERMNAKGDNFTMDDLQHDTESHIDGFYADYIIYNNGTIEEMIGQFNEIMSELANVNFK